MFSYKSTLRNLLSILIFTFLTACGSSGSKSTDSQKTVNNSSATSSSTPVVTHFDLKPVFPLENSNLGGLDETIFKVFINVSNGYEEPISVSANGVSLFNEDGVWRTGDYLIPVNESLYTDVEVVVTDVDGQQHIKILKFGNSSVSITESIQPTDLLLSADLKSIYTLDGNRGRLVEYDFINSTFDEIYAVSYQSTNERLKQVSQYLDSTYIVEKKSAEMTSMIELDSNGSLENYYQAPLNIHDPSGFFIDQEKRLLSSGGELVAYVLDRESDNPLSQWYLSGPYTGENYVVAISTDEATWLSARTSPLSIIQYSDAVLIAREFSSEDNVSIGSIVKIEFTRRLNSFNAKAHHFASFDQGDSKIVKPTAMALNHDQTTLYIADQDKIWAMDLTQESKPFELLSSSSIIPGKKGQGPRLGSSITAMEVHPEHDVLYIAAGAQGIMAVDLETGDRITVAK